MGKIFCQICARSTHPKHIAWSPYERGSGQGHYDALWCNLHLYLNLFLCKYYYLLFFNFWTFSAGSIFFLGPAVTWSCGFCRPAVYHNKCKTRLESKSSLWPDHVKGCEVQPRSSLLWCEIVHGKSTWPQNVNKLLLISRFFDQFSCPHSRFWQQSWVKIVIIKEVIICYKVIKVKCRVWDGWYIEVESDTDTEEAHQRLALHTVAVMMTFNSILLQYFQASFRLVLSQNSVPDRASKKNLTDILWILIAIIPLKNLFECVHSIYFCFFCLYL